MSEVRKTSAFYPLFFSPVVPSLYMSEDVIDIAAASIILASYPHYNNNFENIASKVCSITACPYLQFMALIYKIIPFSLDIYTLKN